MSAHRTAQLAATLFLALAAPSCSRPNPSAAANHYVNPRQCAACHAEISQHYRQTGMARAFYAPSTDAFPNPRPYFHQASRTWFQMVVKDEALVPANAGQVRDGNGSDDAG